MAEDAKKRAKEKALAMARAQDIGMDISELPTAMQNGGKPKTINFEAAYEEQYDEGDE
jgi:hypothetical protein